MGEILRQRAGLKAVALALTGSTVLAGCGIGPDNTLSECPRGWRTDLEIDAGIAVGVLGAIGEEARSSAWQGSVQNTFRDSVLDEYGRNNADQVDEVACITEDDKIVLNPHGAMLVRVAQNAEINLGALSPLGEQLQGEAPRFPEPTAAE